MGSIPTFGTKIDTDIQKQRGDKMQYEYNIETDGICTIYEFMRHGCEKCPKRGKCDEVVQAHYEELKANDTSNRPREHTKCILPNR